MWVQPSIQPYEEPLIYPDNSISTDGSHSRPDPREEKEQITNSPIEATEGSVARGEKSYKTYCTVCHGEQGKGDGPIVKEGLGFYPVNLSAPGVVQRTDGYIYAYIRYGGKVMMPSYRESISEEDAWHIVNYVRKLQQRTIATTSQGSQQ